MDEMEARLAALQEQYVALQDRLNNQATPESPPSHPPAPTAIHKVAVRLPPFWTDKPAVWFAQAEAQFNLSGVTQDSTKYNHIISQLDTRLAAEVEDIITAPPKEGAYQLLKTELVRRLSQSDAERVRKLIGKEELGDRRATQFLRHLKSLAGETPDLVMLKQLWLSRLPNHVQAILTSHSELSLEKLAELADSIMEVSPGSPLLVHSTTSSNLHASNQFFNYQPPAASQAAPTQIAPTPAITTEWLLGLASKVDLLCQQMAVSAIGQQRRSRTRDRSQSRFRSKSRGALATPAQPTICWYHKKFKAEAQRCTTPCTWNNNIPQANSSGNQ